MATKTVAGLRACTWVWLLMLGLTLLTWLIGRAGWEGIGVSLTVLGFAVIKGQLVGDWFMGLRLVMHADDHIVQDAQVGEGPGWPDHHGLRAGGLTVAYPSGLHAVARLNFSETI